MLFTFEREPISWVRPVYRHHRHHPCRPRRNYNEWEDFVMPALDTVNTLNHLLQLSEPRLVQSLASQREEQKQEKFEVKMDVKQFAPEELDVKMIDNFVVIEGKHEEKQDDQGFISRHFVRRYQLPENVKPETVTCNLSSDGVLMVSAPLAIEEKPANERTIPVNFTGKPAVTGQEEKKAEDIPEKMEEAAPSH